MSHPASTRTPKETSQGAKAPGHRICRHEGAINETVVRRLFRELHNRGDASVVDEVFATPALGQQLKQLLGRIHSACSDHYFAIDELILSGDKVVACWTAEVVMAGKALQASGLSIYRLYKGKIVQAWHQWDELRLCV